MDNRMILLIILAAGFLLLIAGAYLLAGKYRKKYKAVSLDEIEGHDFEYYCAELLKKRGFLDVTVTKGSGDYGVDVLAEKDGVTYAIQCKAYATPVGVKAVQEAFAGKEYYDRMVGAVLTNQYFTKPAVEAAKKLKILLWDRGYLDSMIEEE
ncbi:MAG: restriction endonuclease [Lachnospiraceae bacterium]